MQLGQSPRRRSWSQLLLTAATPPQNKPFKYKPWSWSLIKKGSLNFLQMCILWNSSSLNTKGVRQWKKKQRHIQNIYKKWFPENLFNIPIVLSFWLLFLSQTENFHSGVASFCHVCVTPSQHRRERSKHRSWSPVRWQTTRQRESAWRSQRPACNVLAGLAAGQTEAHPPRLRMTQPSLHTSESNLSVFCGGSILFFCFKSLYNSCHFSEDS